jgi:hypothetical protein
MKLGRAYKLAAFAASHKAKAKIMLGNGDHEGAKKEEIAYLQRVDEIPTAHRQQVSPFLDASVQIKLLALQ